MCSQRNSVGTDKENIVPGYSCIIWKLIEAWPLKKNRVTFLRLLKFLKLKKNPMTALRLLKFLILKKGLRHFLPTFKVFNTEKGLHDFLTTLKVFNIERGFHHLLEGLNFEKKAPSHSHDSFKVFQNNYSVECWWIAASESRLSYHIFINELDLPSVPNLIALGMYFLFGIKFSWDEGSVLWFNVKCV